MSFLRYDENAVYLDQKVVYKADSVKISDAQLFNSDIIIVQLKRKHKNIIAINTAGQILWESEDAFEGYDDPYVAFDIKDGYIYAIVRLADVKIDPKTGKVLDKTYSK